MLLSTFFCTDTDMGGANRRMREKIQDEYDAMMICREKVAQRGLPMQIVDAEYQWLVSFLLSASTLYSFHCSFYWLFLFLFFLILSRDRRKLTFYFKADKRVDFRDLTKENFRIFKSRIWMSMVSKDGEYYMTNIPADGKAFLADQHLKQDPRS